MSNQRHSADIAMALAAADPCPFCGSVALELNATPAYVFCHHCDAYGPTSPLTGAPPLGMNRAEHAIYLWNHRGRLEIPATPIHPDADSVPLMIMTIGDELAGEEI